jgi:hypothetical protein
MSQKKTDAETRKERPLATGVLDYFPDALLEVAYTSKLGNDQHNPGQPMHWATCKSMDHADALLRHLVDRGTYDTDGARHSAKVAWRALAMLQTEIDNEKALTRVEAGDETLIDNFKKYQGTLADPTAARPTVLPYIA